jgi:hypothetical protein
MLKCLSGRRVRTWGPLFDSPLALSHRAQREAWVRSGGDIESMGHLGQVVRAMSRNKGQLARYNQVILITGANGRAMEARLIPDNSFSGGYAYKHPGPITQGLDAKFPYLGANPF